MSHSTSDSLPIVGWFPVLGEVYGDQLWVMELTKSDALLGNQGHEKDS